MEVVRAVFTPVKADGDPPNRPWAAIGGTLFDYLRGVPSKAPKAQFSKDMRTSKSVSFSGTLTATGTKPLPQQLPGKNACAISLPDLDTNEIFGDLPSGSHPVYSSPDLP